MDRHISNQNDRESRRQNQGQSHPSKKRKRQSGTQKRVGYFLIAMLAVILTGGGVNELFPLFVESFLTPQVELLESTEASGQMQVTFLDVEQGDCTIADLRQLKPYKTSYKAARSRLNSGFFNAKACQLFKKCLLYGLYGVVFYVIIRYET